MAHITAFLPFLLLCKESSNRWHQITRLFDNTKLSKKAKSHYFLVLNDIQSYSSTKTAANQKEALRNLKTLMTYRTRYNKRLAKENQSRRRASGTMTCPECQATYTNILKYNIHVKNVKKKMCVLCNTLVDLDEYKTHLNSHAVTVFACNSCPEAFLKETSLNIHRSKHKGNHYCVECKQSFVTSANLAVHLVKHRSEICTGCNKKFTNKICYTRHKKKCINKDNLKTYICDYCSKVYKKRNTLKLHIFHNHLSGKQFQCDQCGRTFLSRVHLAEHNNTHNKILDRYICSKCGSKFSTRRGYERHFKKHDSATFDPMSKKMKYVCPICNKVYYQKKSIDSHMRVKHDVVKISFE